MNGWGMRWVLGCLAMGTWGLAGAADAAGGASLRDPTAVPRHAQPPRAAASGATSSERELTLAVMINQGKPFVMADSRLYAVGDKLGTARIERISETEVWLRDGKELRKVSLYPGVQRLQVVPVKE